MEIDRYKNRKIYEECICKSCNGQEIEDLHHVIVKCKGYLELRKQKLSFMTDASEIEFYENMNKMTKKELKLIAEFMQSVELTNNK